MTQITQQFCRERFDETGALAESTVTIPPDFNYGYDVLDQLAREVPDRLALLWRSDKGEEKRLTFAQMKTYSNQAAQVLRAAGLQKGDVMTAALRCHWEYWILALAAHKLGLIFSPVYWRLTVRELARRLEQAGSRAVVCCRDGDTPAAMRAAADLTGVALRFAVGGAEEGFTDFSAAMETAPDTLERVPTSAEEPALLYFTSGSTGQPKGVLHDHAYMLAAWWGARYMQDIHDGSLHFATGDTGWEVVSGTKFYGQWLCLGALFVYDYDRFPPEQVLRELEKYRVTSVMAQPTVYRQLTDVGMDRFDLSSITCYAVGGEKLPPDLAQTVLRQTGQPLYEGYAQSEAGLIAANSKALGRREGSVGRILPKYHIELLGEGGAFLPSGEAGEIVLVADGGRRPAGVLLGYWKDAEATRRLWDGAVFHTGDLAWRDEDGYLYYLGREDGMIKTKGYRVSPVEIEDLLSRHPAVEECLAAGVPDRDLGQKIVVYVKPAPGYAPTQTLARELMAYHNDSCAGYKKIRQLLFVEGFARNANGKIIRDQFAAAAAQP